MKGNAGMKNKQRPTPDIPTRELVFKYITAFTQNNLFVGSDCAILALLQAFPKNCVLHEVLAKVCVINDLYATRILAVFDMAEHIVKLKIDDQLAMGATEIVDRIANLTISGKIRNNFSFATKYCAWHKPLQYPMYDSFVSDMLLAYRDKYKFMRFKNKELRQYASFKKIILGFASHYDLAIFSFRELDHFLWGYGKELFPRQYKNNTEVIDTNNSIQSLVEKDI